jgi:hypothetical protein
MPKVIVGSVVGAASCVMVFFVDIVAIRVSVSKRGTPGMMEE